MEARGQPPRAPPQAAAEEKEVPPQAPPAAGVGIFRAGRAPIVHIPYRAQAAVPQPAVAILPVAQAPAAVQPARDYGGAYSVDIGSQAPVWSGSAIALGLFALRFGSIQVDQTATTIRVTKRSKGDSNKIAKFIKRVFRLGGHLNGVKMTSQRLTRHIIAKLPGTFAITA